MSAFVYKALDLPMLPEFINKTGGLLGVVALPLALICAGATLNIKSMISLSGLSMQASIGRIVIAPLLAVVVGVAFALEPLQFGVLFFDGSKPSSCRKLCHGKGDGR